MITVVSNLRQFSGFLRALRFPPPNKSDRHDMAEILLKVALNTRTPSKDLKAKQFKSRNQLRLPKQRIHTLLEISSG